MRVLEGVVRIKQNDVFEADRLTEVSVNRPILIVAGDSLPPLLSISVLLFSPTFSLLPLSSPFPSPLLPAAPSYAEVPCPPPPSLSPGRVVRTCDSGAGLQWSQGKG